MPLLDHLRELRRRVILILLIIAAGALLGWFLYGHILDVLRQPYCSVPAKYRFQPKGPASCVLIYQGALEGFTTRLKVSTIAGAVLTGPLWLYQIWAFITPALRQKERKYTLIFVLTSTVLFGGGMTVAYFVLSRGLHFVLKQSGYGTAALLTLNNYISFVTMMLVVFGAAFELPLLVVMANFAGVLPSRMLRRTRRVAIFLIFVFAAVATPSTDPFTMCAMAVPIVVLFEVAVRVAIVHDRHKHARLEAERAAPHPEDAVPSQLDPFPEPLA